MFREPITADPKTARRVFILLVPSALAMIPLAAWSIILQNWLLVAICVFAEADITTTATRHYIVGWPGSWVDSYRGFLSIHVSEAQWLLAGLVFLVATLAPLLVLGQAQKQLVLGVIGLVSAVWLFRLMRAIRKEGWRGKKDGTG
jgi:hypothetical protein